MDSQRLIRFAVAFGVCVVVLFSLRWYWSQPSLYDGDRIEVRECRDCGGKNESCRTCGGALKVKVIVPGSNRPVTVAGDVYEQKVRYPGTKNVTITWVRLPGASPRDPMPGAIGGATVVFTDDKGQTVSDTCTPGGAFVVKLKPGRYRVSAEAAGFERYEKEFEVPVMTGGIWLEKRPLNLSRFPSEDMPEAKRDAVDKINLGIGMTRS